MATIKDVAKLSGVSVTTVSRVLNDKGYISDQTRQAVFKAMEALDYQPNEVARSLFRQESKMFGLILPSVAHPFFAQFTQSVEFFAHANGYKVMLCQSLFQSEKEKEYMELLKRSQVDGIITLSHTQEVDYYMGAKLPMVTFDRKIGEEIPYVASDNFKGGMLGATHLIERGCQKIAYVSGNLSLDLLSNQRSLGFIEACESKGINYVMIQAPVNALESIDYQDEIAALLSTHPDIDGIFGSSDLIAAQAILVCGRLGKLVGRDVLVVGYDDVDFAKYYNPPMTSIAQPIEAMAKASVESLINQIQGKKVPLEVVLPVSLVVRETT